MKPDATDLQRRSASRIGPGALVAVVGPSGAGKDTLIRAARAEIGGDVRFHFVRRLVTRNSSTADEDHEMVDPAAFERMVQAGECALSWRAHGLGYALPLSMDHAVAAGRVAVANLSRGVIGLARERYASCCVVEIRAPADVLFRRLCERRRESVEDIRRRVARAADPIEGSDVVRIDNGGSLAEARQKFLETLFQAAQSDRPLPSTSSQWF
jgi:ribose 1,5-bisphosphokinase